jgi:type I restriction enzyme S subunit
MTPQELRASIIQQAIQGKLVEQRPEEGTGEELFQQIQAKKQALIKAGKIKKEKSLPEIAEDEMLFDIPGTWCWVRLADLVEIYTGKKDANFGSPDGQYDFFTCSNQPIKCKSYSYDGEYLIMPGNGANIGMVIHYKGKFEAYQRTYLLENTYGIFMKYLKYHLESNWKQYNADKMYGSAIPYIKLGNLTNYCVALPPLAEQKRIVAKLEEILPLRERLK